MVQKLEDIKGGGGSIKVGTTGTIGALMTRELESVRSSPQASLAVSVATDDKRVKTRKSFNEASSSRGNRSMNHESPETPQKTKGSAKSTHRIPMLGADDISLDRTPSRDTKSFKKGTNIVEIVDIRCGHPDKAWTGPITNKLKKLGFSKLSEGSIV